MLGSDMLRRDIQTDEILVWKGRALAFEYLAAKLTCNGQEISSAKLLESTCDSTCCCLLCPCPASVFAPPFSVVLPVFCIFFLRGESFLNGTGVLL